MDNPKVSGETLRAAREAAGMSLREMAAAALISKSYLGLMEQGKRPIRIDVAARIRQIAMEEDMNRRTIIAALVGAPVGAGAMLKNPDNAESTLNYGLSLADQGKLDQAHYWYEIAATISDLTGHSPTQGYVRARAASRGLYEGWSAARTVDTAREALATSRDSRTVVEAHAALTHVHVRRASLPKARQSAGWMQRAAADDRQQVRAAAFANYAECCLGDLKSATRVYEQAAPVLAQDAVMAADARVYLGLALVRAGDRDGMSEALAAARSLPREVRIVGVGVSDLLKAVPPAWHDDDAYRELTAFARV